MNWCRVDSTGREVESPKNNHSSHVSINLAHNDNHRVTETMMYQSFYNLSGVPFAFAPNPACFYANNYTRESLRTLRRVIGRAEGTALVVGPTGTGKSTVCQLVVDHFGSSHQIVHLHSAGFSTRRAMVEQCILCLGVTTEGQSEAHLRTALRRHLFNLVDHPQQVLMVVDEAHLMTPEMAAELRMLHNLVHDGSIRIGMVLAGTLKLEELLAHPTLESFNQRVAHRCYLAAASRMETKSLINEQLVQVGSSVSKVFTQDALRRIYEFTEGVPRLINLLADRCLVLGCARKVAMIDEFDVEIAWADLQQLPEPKPEAPPQPETVTAPAAVEFGVLSDG